METIKNQKFSELVKWLKLMGIVRTDKDLAEKWGKSRSLVSELLAGKREFSDTYAVEFCSAFPDVNPNYFIDDHCHVMFKDGVETPATATAPLTDLEKAYNALLEENRFLRETVKELTAAVTAAMRQRS